MEKMVTDSDIQKVIIISDKEYAEKSDTRKGGVGTEAQIISPKIYEKGDQKKFVAVVTELDDSGKAYLPTYYKSLIYIDMSNLNEYSDSFERLLRWIYDHPAHEKPKLGKKPAYLKRGQNRVSSGTSSIFKRAQDALKQDKPTAMGAVNEYLTVLSENMERFRVMEANGDIEEQVVNSIDMFLPAKNEFIHLLKTISQYAPNEDYAREIHRFIESVIPYMDVPKHLKSYSDHDFDNFKFFVHELFLSALAVLIKNEKFQMANTLMEQPYYVPGRTGPGMDNMVSYDHIFQHVGSLENRNKRLKTNRTSLRTDQISARCAGSGLEFSHILQADFIAFMRLEIMETEDWHNWYPQTLSHIPYHTGCFEVFARARSTTYFNKMKCLLGISSPDDMKDLLDRYRVNSNTLPRWSTGTINASFLMGFKNLAKHP
jgi:hypothetical protein